MKIQFPRLDDYGTPTEKLQNCPQCDEDELGVITPDYLLCYSCGWSMDSEGHPVPHLSLVAPSCYHLSEPE